MSDGAFSGGDDMTDEQLEELLQDVAARIGPENPSLLTPPPAVWSAIERRLDEDPLALEHQPSNVTSLEHHRRRRRPAGILLGAVAASVIAAVAVGAVLSRGGNAVLNEVDLASLSSQQRFGTATVVEAGGTLVLDVDLDTDLEPGAGQFYELWLIDTQVEGMYSLGRISSDGSFPVPEGVDPADYPIVDISVEDDDGDPTHSGNSVYRGIFEF